MKKIFFLSLLVITLFLGIKTVHADVPANEMNRQLQAAAGPQGGNLSAPVDPRLIAANIIYIALGILGTIFIVLTVYAGFLWMTAGGNDENIKKAKGILYAGIIGLLIILSAYAITLYVFDVVLSASNGGGSFTY